MKWDCGKRKRERIARLIAYYTAAQEWHDVFVWWPKKLADNDCRWMETIQQRFVVYKPDSGQYALLRYSIEAQIKRYVESADYTTPVEGYWEVRAKPKEE